MTKRAASPKQASEHTGPQVERQWTGQELGARSLRVLVAVLPTIAATICVLFLVRLIPADQSVPIRVVSLVAVAGAGFGAASATSRFTVKLLPLAVLMRLSLVFPDQAPSRLKLAIHAASRKRLKAEVESARHHGLSSDITEAAGQVLLLTAALGEHDRRTRGHSERVRLYARMLGEELGILGDDLDRLQWGALLHDVGKLTIPKEILNKPSKLEPTEWAIMAGHASAGTEMVAPLHPFLGEFVSAADGHHEKWDGSGYPSGLSGQQIPIAARIVAVADAYEVMTAVRAYKRPMSSEAARAELTACAGTHFDPDVVRAWLRLAVGDVNKATGPMAAMAGLPLVGHFVSLFSRAASQISSVPAAMATAAPAAATAGAMTLAMVATPPPPISPPDLGLELRPTTSTTWSASSERTPSTTSRASSALDGVTTTPTSSLFGPSSTAPTTPSTTAPPTTTSTTAAPTTAPPTTAPATTTSTTAAPITAPPTATGPLQTNEILTPNEGAPLTVAGPIPANADLSSSGPFGSGTFLFQDAAQTLTSNLDVAGRTIPAGSVVCVHLFLTSESDGGAPWKLDYTTQVLAVTRTAAQLVSTDGLSAPGVDYGPQDGRGLGHEDTVKINSGGARVHMKLEGSTMDSVRVFLDCSS